MAITLKLKPRGGLEHTAGAKHIACEGLVLLERCCQVLGMGKSIKWGRGFTGSVLRKGLRVLC